MNRRDFLSLRKGSQQTLDLRCEELFMHYVQAKARRRLKSYLRRLRRRLAEVSLIRLHNRHWLEEEGLRRHLEPLLREARSKGIRIEES